jgi:hypothetical protein
VVAQSLLRHLVQHVLEKEHLYAPAAAGLRQEKMAVDSGRYSNHVQDLMVAEAPLASDSREVAIGHALDAHHGHLDLKALLER